MDKPGLRQAMAKGMDNFLGELWQKVCCLSEQLSNAAVDIETSGASPLTVSEEIVDGVKIFHLSWANNTGPNLVLASPDGTPGPVSMRALVPTDIPNLNASKITTGIFDPERLGSGTPDNNTFLNGDGVWVTLPPGGLTLANEGLSSPDDGMISYPYAQLGQAIGAPGNPAKLTSHRVIPTEGYTISLTDIGSTVLDSGTITLNGTPSTFPTMIWSGAGGVDFEAWVDSVRFNFGWSFSKILELEANTHRIYFTRYEDGVAPLDAPTTKALYTDANGMVNFGPIDFPDSVGASSGVHLDTTDNKIKLGLNMSDPTFQDGAIPLGQLCYITQGEDIANSKQIGILFQGTGDKLDILGTRGAGLPAAGFTVQVGDTQSQVAMVANDNNSGSPLSGGMQMVFNATGGSSGMAVMDTVNERGLEYVGDYELNFLPRSLITKQYLESRLIFTGVLNGLSVNGTNSVVLGQDMGSGTNPATLISNREIPTAGFSVSFTEIDTIPGIKFSNKIESDGITINYPGKLNYTMNYAGSYIESQGGSGFPTTIGYVAKDLISSGSISSVINGGVAKFVADNTGFHSGIKIDTLSGDITVFTQAGETARITVKNGGNVGIGTTNPNATLQVVSPLVTAGVLIGSSAATPYHVLRVESFYEQLALNMSAAGGIAGLALQNETRDTNTDYRIMYQYSGKTLIHQLAPGAAATGYSMFWAKNSTTNWGRLVMDNGHWQFGPLGTMGSTIADNGYMVQVFGNLFVNTYVRLNPQATAPASPTKGMLYVNNTTNQFLGYNGTTWVDLGASGGTVTANNGLSVEGGNVVLGQAAGEAGNPAALTNSRQIPVDGFGIDFTVLASGDRFGISDIGGPLEVGYFSGDGEFDAGFAKFTFALGNTVNTAQVFLLVKDYPTVQFATSGVGGNVEVGQRALGVINIGTSPTVGTPDPPQVAYFDAINNRLGVNQSAPTQTLDVNGLVRIRGGSPGIGKVLTSDASGNASWATPSGSSVVVGTPVYDLDTRPYAKDARGAQVQGGELIMQTASDAVPGLLSITAQNIAGNKTFINKVYISNGGTPTANDIFYVYRNEAGNFFPIGAFEDGLAEGYVQFGLRGPGTVWHFGKGNSGESFFNVANKFFVFDVTNSVMRLVIDDTGKTGINQAQPTAYMDLPAAIAANASLRIRPGTNPTSPNDGDLWIDDTTDNLYVRLNGVTKQLNDQSGGSSKAFVQYSATSNTAVTNTSSETSLIPGGTFTGSKGVNGTANIAAGTVLKMRGSGLLQVAASGTNTPTIRFKVGDVTVPLNITGMTSAINPYYEYEAQFIFFGSGASQTVEYIVKFSLFSQFGWDNPKVFYDINGATISTTTGTVNVDVTAQWNIADPDNGVNPLSNYMELIKV